MAERGSGELSGGSLLRDFLPRAQIPGFQSLHSPAPNALQRASGEVRKHLGQPGLGERHVSLNSISNQDRAFRISNQKLLGYVLSAAPGTHSMPLKCVRWLVI